LSTVSTALVEDLAAEPGMCGSRSTTCAIAFWHRLVGRADKTGCQALVLTTDVPVCGNREWDQRSYARLRSCRGAANRSAAAAALAPGRDAPARPAGSRTSPRFFRAVTPAPYRAKFVGDQLDPTGGMTYEAA
jgi:isopentenyl diphosphate isomerase/L-lactate dehydrogenase-like FMN-dependent dehydrogenase